MSNQLATYMSSVLLKRFDSLGLKCNCVCFLQGPPTDAPAVDTAEQVYISSLALLKVRIHTVPLSHMFSFIAVLVLFKT